MMSDKCFIMIQTTPSEKEKIKQDAQSHNCNLSEYIRYLVAKERKEMKEIERIRNIPRRECISQKEMEKYRLVEKRKEREK